MRAAKVQASLRIRAVSPEPPQLAHTSSKSKGTCRQKARSLAPLNGWACAVEICHDGMLEDTNSLDAAQFTSRRLVQVFVWWQYCSTHIKMFLVCSTFIFSTSVWTLNFIILFLLFHVNILFAIALSAVGLVHAIFHLDQTRLKQNYYIPCWHCQTLLRQDVELLFHTQCVEFGCDFIQHAQAS